MTKLIAVLGALSSVDPETHLQDIVSSEKRIFQAPGITDAGDFNR